MGPILAAQEASYPGELKGEMDGVRVGAGVRCIELLTDSRSAKYLAESPIYHGRSKHIKAKWHCIRKRVELGMVKLIDVRTEFMGADMLTKGVGTAALAVNMRLIGMAKCG